MSLPRIDVPTYTTVLPSTGQTISFRPFLVKEQKQLLMSVNGSTEQQIAAITNLVTVCTNGVITADSPAYDVEHVFLQIRARSVGENIDLILTCNNCEHQTDAKLDITQIDVKNADQHERDVNLGNGLILSMSDPTLSDLSELKQNTSADNIVMLIARCINKIWKNDEVYDVKDYTQSDLVEFVENLSPQNLTKLESFFETLPVVRHELNYTCSKCGSDNTAVLEGLQSFFV